MKFIFSCFKRAITSTTQRLCVGGVADLLLNKIRFQANRDDRSQRLTGLLVPPRCPESVRRAVGPDGTGQVGSMS